MSTNYNSSSNPLSEGSTRNETNESSEYQSNSQSNNPDDQTYRIKHKRRRKPINCSFCRQRKIKCDRKQPCSNCIKRNIQNHCTYASEPTSLQKDLEEDPVSAAANSISLYGSSRVSIENQTNSTSFDLVSTINPVGPSSSIPKSNQKAPLDYPSMPSSIPPSSTSSQSLALNNPSTDKSQVSTYNTVNFYTPITTQGSNSNINTGLNQNEMPSISYDSNLENFTPSVALPPPSSSSMDKLLSNIIENTYYAVPQTSLSTDSFAQQSNSENLETLNNATLGTNTRSTERLPIKNPLQPQLFTNTSTSNHQKSRNNSFSNINTTNKSSRKNSNSSSTSPSLNYFRRSSPRYSNSSNRSSAHGSPEDTINELQTRLETMERLLVTVIKQQSKSPENSPPNPKIQECRDNMSESPENQKDIKDKHFRPYPIATLCGRTEYVNDDEMVELRQSLGLLKLDSTGKSVYHGDTHWGSLITEIDAATSILGKLKTEYAKFVNTKDKGNSKNSTTDEAESSGAGHSASNPQNQTSSQQKSEEEAGGTCFNSHPFFSEVQSNESYIKILDSLPPREQCTTLVRRYFESINCIYPIVNPAYFWYEYDIFWKSPRSTEVSWLGMLLAILALGLQTYSTGGIVDYHGISSNKSSTGSPESQNDKFFPPYFRDEQPSEYWNMWLEGAKYCTDSWKLNFRPSLTNLRAMIIIMISQHDSSIDFDWTDRNWIDIATIIRIAETMGLHRDPQWFAIDDYDREERRRMWHLLQHLDLFNTLIQGLPAMIQPTSMDVEVPCNLNLDSVARMSPKYRVAKGFDIEENISLKGRSIPGFGIRSSIFNKSSQGNVKTVKTELSYFLARCHNSMFTLMIYNLTTNLDETKVPYEILLEYDSKIRYIYNKYHPYLSKSVIDSSMLETPTHNVFDNENSTSSMSESSPNSIHPVDHSLQFDDDQSKLERFLFEIDYLKAVITLHRKYSARGLDDLKYRRSREEVVYSAEQMLKLQEWFYRSKDARNLREKYAYIVTKFAFPHFIHATFVLSLYSLTNIESYPLHVSKAHLRRIEIACDITMDVGLQTGDIYASKHIQILVILLKDAKAMFNMRPEERAKIKEERKRRKDMTKDKQRRILKMMFANANNHPDNSHNVLSPSMDDIEGEITGMRSSSQHGGDSNAASSNSPSKPGDDNILTAEEMEQILHGDPSSLQKLSNKLTGELSPGLEFLTEDTFSDYNTFKYANRTEFEAMRENNETVMQGASEIFQEWRHEHFDIYKEGKSGNSSSK